jgi:hypothetical protein
LAWRYHHVGEGRIDVDVGGVEAEPPGFPDELTTSIPAT